MATRFEIVLYGRDAVSLRAAGEEALNEIERLEEQLSLFIPSSEIANLNAKAAEHPVRLTPPVFELLRHAKQLTQETGGAFDVTIAPLMRCWGFLGGAGHVPSQADLAAARESVGATLLELDPQTWSVRFARKGVMVDLGAIGKGYAIDCAVAILREAGIESALIHGGTSTVYGLGSPPDAECWKVEIPGPRTMQTLRHANSAGPAHFASAQSHAQDNLPDKAPPFATVSLCNTSLSVSAVWGKCFQTHGKSFGHIIDPRSGEPAKRGILSAVVLASATETDALSTALLTLGPPGHQSIADLRPGIQTLVVNETESGFEVCSQGIQPTWTG